MPRFIPAFLLSLVVGGASACAMSYSSMYQQTNNRLSPPPVSPKKVKVVKSQDDLTSKWTAIGNYRGHAPTVNEAMQAAQQQCGSHGAHFFILNTAPYASGSVWRVDGICAVRQ